MPPNTNRIKLSVLLNGILLLALLLLAGREGYLSRLFNRKSPPAESGPTAFIPENRPAYHEQVDFYPLYKSHPKIVMLGNSLTYKMEWNELLDRADVVNRGVMGDITLGMLQRLEYIVPLQPAICFIEGGVNDVDEHIPQDTILKNMSRMVDTLRQHHIIPVFMTITHVAAFYPDSKSINSAIRSVNSALENMATKNGIDLIDINKIIAPGYELQDSVSKRDGIHLNSKAYVPWRDEIRRVLNKYKI